eukprot:m51a1_g6360 hypothetical protein (397) ;mRNA; f:101465-102840
MRAVARVFLALVGVPLLVAIWASTTFYPAWRLPDLFLRAADLRSGATSPPAASHPLPWVLGSVATVLPLAVVPILLLYPTRPLRAVSTLLLTAWLSLHQLSVLLAVWEVARACVAPGRLDRVDALAALTAAWAAVCAVGVVNAVMLCGPTITLRSAKVTRRVRIAHISDVHIGSRGKWWMAKVAEEIKRGKPDMVLVTGDLIDTHGVTADELSPLGATGAPVYLSLGNHDIMVGAEEVTKLIKQTPNVTLLRDEVATVRTRGPKPQQVRLVGIDDRGSEGEMTERLEEVVKSGSNADELPYTVLLYHRPHGFPHVARKGLADLFLAGHTHGGQTAPFAALVKIAFWRMTGLWEKHGRHLYVSPGSGTWGPVIRLMYTNRVTFIDVVPHKPVEDERE